MSELGEDIEALRKDPTSSEAASRVREGARAHGALSQYAEAFAERGRRLAEDGHLDGATQSLLEAAQVYEEELEDLEAAGAVYQAVLDLEPRNRRALFALGLILHELERFPELAALYRRRLEHSEDDGERTTLYLYLAEILADQLGDEQGAFDAVVRAACLSPQNLRVITRLEALGERAGRPAEVAVVLGDLLMHQEDPRVRAALTLRLAELSMGPLADEARALAHYRSALADDGGNPRTLARVEDVFRERERFDALADLLEEVARDRRVGPQRIRLERELARVLEHELGDTRRAFNVISRAAREAPDDRDLIDEVLRLGTAAAALDQVAEVLAEVADRSSNALLRTFLRLKLGHILAVLLDRPLDAMSAYEAVLAEDPSHKEALRRLEALAARTGEWARLTAATAPALMGREPRPRAPSGREARPRTPSGRAAQTSTSTSAQDPTRGASGRPTTSTSTSAQDPTHTPSGRPTASTSAQDPTRTPSGRPTASSPEPRRAPGGALRLGAPDPGRSPAARPGNTEDPASPAREPAASGSTPPLRVVPDRGASMAGLTVDDADVLDDQPLPASPDEGAPVDDADVVDAAPEVVRRAGTDELEALIERAIAEGELERAFFAQVRLFRAAPTPLGFERLAELARRAGAAVTLSRLSDDLLPLLPSRARFGAELALAEVEPEPTGEERLVRLLDREADEPDRVLELRARLARKLTGEARAEQHLLRAALFEAVGAEAEQAGVEYALAATAAPGWPRAIEALARHRERLGDFRSAVELLEQQAENETDPRRGAEVWARVAELSRGTLADPVRAERAFREALLRDPDDLRAEAGLGELCLARGDPDSAHPHLARAARGLRRSDPEQALALYRQAAEAAHTLGAGADERSALEAVEELEPGSERVRLRLLALAVEHQDLRRARALVFALEAESAVSGSARAELLVLSARTELLAGRLDESRQRARLACELSPGLPSAERVLAELDERAAEAEKAVPFLESALARWVALDEPTRALSVLERLRTGGRPSPELEAWLLLDAAVRDPHRLEDAERAWLALLARDPARVDALEILVFVAERRGAHASAEWRRGLLAALGELDGAPLRPTPTLATRLPGWSSALLPHDREPPRPRLRPGAGPLRARLERWSQRYADLSSCVLALHRWTTPRGARTLAADELGAAWRAVIEALEPALPRRPALVSAADPLTPDEPWRTVVVDDRLALLVTREPPDTASSRAELARALALHAPGVVAFARLPPLVLRDALEGLAGEPERPRGDPKEARRRARTAEKAEADDDARARLRALARAWAADPERPSLLQQRNEALLVGDLAAWWVVGSLAEVLAQLRRAGAPVERRVALYLHVARLIEAEVLA